MRGISAKEQLLLPLSVASSAIDHPSLDRVLRVEVIYNKNICGPERTPTAQKKKKTQGGWSMAGSATLSRQGECPLAAIV